MAAVFLVVLVLAWLAWCLKATTRARDTGVVGSTDSFRRGLELIGPDHHSDFIRTYGRLAPVEPIGAPTSGRDEGSTVGPLGVVDDGDVVAGRRSSPVSEPRRIRRASKPLRLRHVPLTVFVGLSLGALVSLGAALFGGAWELHLAFDAALALFVSWLFEDQHRRSVERRRKVTPLPRRRADFSDLAAVAGDR